MDWKTLLAYISGSVDEELLLRNEYLVAENHILRDQIKGRVQLSDAERQTLAEIGKKLGKQALEEIATAAKPDTILGWHRKLVAQKFDGSDQRQPRGRPRVEKDVEDLVVEMAKANRSWGYDRLAGALAALGYAISDQTVGNILKRRGLPPAPERQKTRTWREFSHPAPPYAVFKHIFLMVFWPRRSHNHRRIDVSKEQGARAPWGSELCKPYHPLSRCTPSTICPFSRPMPTNWASSA
jgi:transposase